LFQFPLELLQIVPTQQLANSPRQWYFSYGIQLREKFAMPTYVYGPVLKGKDTRNCDACAGSFEIIQKMSDEALTKCPQCGGEIQRIITAPNLNGVGLMGRKPSADRMSKAGFTQYKRNGKGYYEKQFGQGPSALHG
jgi:putative FmdB family regulatory protein